MNDRQLNSFILAADSGSFSKAAAASYISTPALMQQINLLEADLGFKLFDRSSHGVALTAAGRDFYGTAKEILELYEKGKAKGRAATATQKEILRVGCDTTEAPPFLIELCQRFEQSDPQSSILFVGCSYADQIDGLAAGDFDLAFLPELARIKSRGMDFTPIYQDPYFCCVSPKDELADKTLVSLEDLDGQTIYLEQLYRDEPQIMGLEEELKLRGIEVVYDTTPFSAALPLKMVVEGGVLPSPGRYLQSCVPPLAAVPLNWGKANYGIATRKDAGDLVESFTAFAKSYFGDPA